MFRSLRRAFSASIRGGQDARKGRKPDASTVEGGVTQKGCGPCASTMGGPDAQKGRKPGGRTMDGEDTPTGLEPGASTMAGWDAQKELESDASTIEGLDTQKGLRLALKFMERVNIVGEELFDVHRCRPWIAFVSPEKPRLLRVWNYETEQMVSEVPTGGKNHDGKLWGVKFIGQNDRVVVVLEHELVVYETLVVDKIMGASDLKTEERKIYRRFLLNIADFSNWAVHSTAQCIALAVHSPVGSNYKIYFWDLDHDFHEERGTSLPDITIMRIHPVEAHIFATVHNNGTLNMWDAKTMSVLRTLEGMGEITSLQFCSKPQKSLIVTGHMSGHLSMWNYQSKKRVAIFPVHGDRVVEAFFHPELPCILSASLDGTITVWSASVERTICSGLKGFSGQALCRNGITFVRPCKDTLRFMTILLPDGDDVLKMKQLETVLSTVRAERRALEEGFEKEMQTHDQMITQIDGEIRNLRIESQELKERFERLGSDHQREKGIHSERVKQLETAVSDVRAERRALEERFEEERETNAGRIKELETELYNVRVERKGLGERFESFQSVHDMEIGMHAERVKQLEIKISNLRGEREALKETFEKQTVSVQNPECGVETGGGADERLERSDGVPKGVPQVDSHPFREFSLDELKTATNDFHDDCKLEQQHYACAYMGRITPITVKRLEYGKSMTHNRHGRLTRELVDLLKSLQHPHLQILLGVCYAGNCLVYEYMANGNVKEWISSAKGSHRSFLPWYVRLRIMAQVAKALSFLHSSPSLGGGQIIHCNIQLKNIFLDSNFVAKITEVDMALLAPPPAEDGETTDMDRFHGSDAKYLAPEFFRTEVFTPQTDIYAFGITLLEMLTGKFKNTLGIMEDAVEDSATFRSTLDPNAGSWDIDLAFEAARVGLRCASLNKSDRPRMTTGEGAILPALEGLAEKAELVNSRSKRVTGSEC